MNKKELALAKQVSDAVMNGVLPYFKNHATTIRALKERVAELEQKAGVKKAFDPQPGDIFMMGNGKWLCKAPGRFRRVD